MSKKPKQSASVIGDHEYEVMRIRDKDGKLRTSRGNNDAVARAMLLFKAGGGDIDTIVHANKLDDKMKPHRKKQDGLKRMTLGVMLRALVKGGTPVKIGKVTVDKLSQKVELPKVEKLNGAKQAAPKKRAKAKSAAPRKRRPKSHSHSVDNVPQQEAA